VGRTVDRAVKAGHTAPEMTTRTIKLFLLLAMALSLPIAVVLFVPQDESSVEIDRRSGEVLEHHRQWFLFTRHESIYGADLTKFGPLTQRRRVVHTRPQRQFLGREPIFLPARTPEEIECQRLWAFVITGFTVLEEIRRESKMTNAEYARLMNHRVELWNNFSGENSEATYKEISLENTRLQLESR
jgi:hypothetical protein